MRTSPRKISRLMLAGSLLTVAATSLPLSLRAQSCSSSPSQSDDCHNNGPYVWKNVQIVGGGFVTGIIGHPKVKNLRYVRTDIGGAYRWDQTLQRWIPLTDFVGLANDINLLGIESLAIDPNAPERLYLAAGTYAESWSSNGAIFVSEDQGNSFKTVPLPIKLGSNDAGRFAGERLQVDPNNGKFLYFGSRLNGLWRSSDHGNSWAQVGSFPVKGTTGSASDPGVGVIFEQFEKSSGTTMDGATRTMYVGVSDPTVGLYVSNDGGATFVPVPNQPSGFYPNSVSEDSEGSLYISYSVSLYGNSVGPYSVSNGQIWKYTPPGSGNPAGTWSNITPPKPSYYNWGYGSVAVDPHNSNNIMVSTLDRYYPPPQDDIYRSHDGGKTWESIDANSVRDTSRSPWLLGESLRSVGAGNWANHLWIDPFDSNHVLYGTGATIQETFDASDADGVSTTPGTIVAGGTTHWDIGAKGIEEVAVQSLISPPSGPAHLISGMYDLGGFTHLDLTQSPIQGSFTNPQTNETDSLDFAQNAPRLIARVGGSYNSGPGQLGAYSTDGGLNWTPFASYPTGVTGGRGSVSVSADGSTIAWAPGDGGSTVFYSTDRGTTWTPAKGAPVVANNNWLRVLSDRVNPKKFFVYDPTTLGLYTSSDGAQTFTLTQTLTSGILRISPAAEGDLWFGTGSGLSHSSDSGVTFAPVAGVQSAFSLGFGMAAPMASHPTIFVYGQVNKVSGVFRSTNWGVSWVQVNDYQHQFGYVYQVTGDPRIFGRVYLGTNGRGILYGDPKPH